MGFINALAAFKGFPESGIQAPDTWWLYLLYALIVIFVSAEAIFYLVKSYKKAKKIGMDMTKIKKVITTSASFSILPAIGIGIGVVTLIGALGIALPAIRLSVIGALQYETQMADGAAQALTGKENGMAQLLQIGVTPQDFATIALLMTISIILGPILVVLFYKKLQPKLTKLGAMQVGGKVDPDNATKSLEQDVKKSEPNGVNLGDLVFQISFIGMIIGYLAMSIGTMLSVSTLDNGHTFINGQYIYGYYNFIAVIVSAGCMVLFDYLITKKNQKWLDSFSTAFSMLIAMAVVGIIAFVAQKNGWDPTLVDTAAANGIINLVGGAL